MAHGSMKVAVATEAWAAIVWATPTRDKVKVHRVDAIVVVVLWVVRPAEASAQTKVSQLDMTVTINEDVVLLQANRNKYFNQQEKQLTYRLDITMNEAHFVNGLDGKH